jgi:triosephosphate isomerase
VIISWIAIFDILANYGGAPAAGITNNETTQKRAFKYSDTRQKMKKLWVGCGWKMNKTRGEAVSYANTIRKNLKNSPTRCTVFLIPPFTSIYTVSQILHDTDVLVGAQNMHWKDSGAHTGEISPLMLLDCGVHLVELGHSERRIDNNETDETVNLKTLSALKYGLKPLICVGESLAEKDSGAGNSVITRQVSKAIKGVSSGQIGNVMFAYEPVWSIGEKGKPADAEYVNNIHELIRKVVEETINPVDPADMPLVLYGGSVSAENAPSYVRQTYVDGLFIGRAAWKAEGFLKILKIAEESVLDIPDETL